MAGLGNKRSIEWSAVLLILVFGFTAIAGYDLFQFETLGLSINNSIVSAENASSSGATNYSRDLAAYTDQDGTAFRARGIELKLVLRNSRDNFAEIDEALTRIASVAPTASATWQALAVVRQARNFPRDRVLAAFEMSILTGSHEGRIMIDRGAFGLDHWRELPTDMRSIVIEEVIETINPEYGAAARYRKSLEDEPKAEQDEIRAALLASGFTQEQTTSELGL